jgi:hypothetical protein
MRVLSRSSSRDHVRTVNNWAIGPESALRKIIVRNSRNKTTVTTKGNRLTLNQIWTVHQRRKELLTALGEKRKLSTSGLMMLARVEFDDIFGFTMGVTPPAHAKQDKPKLNPFLVYIDSFANMSFVANEHLL